MLQKLVKKCHENLCEKDLSCICDGCENECQGSCKECLQKMHFENTGRKYNCKNMSNYYVCKYSYRYSSEIAKVLERLDILNENENYNIVSFGCGPGTDFIGFHEYIENQDYDVNLKYFGIELCREWKKIHNFIIDMDISKRNLRFLYNDAFKVLEKSRLIKRAERTDFLIFQYVLSDMEKNHTYDEISDFMRKVSTEMIVKMPKKSYIWFNDINHNKVRKFYDVLEDELNELGIEFETYHYHFNGYTYGEKLDDKLIYDKILEKELYVNQDSMKICKSAGKIIRIG